MEKTIMAQLESAIRRELDSGVTAYQLAKRAGIDQSQLSRFLAGARSLKLETASKLCSALGLLLYRRK